MINVYGMNSGKSEYENRKEGKEEKLDWRNYNFTVDYPCENIQQFC